MKLLSHIKWHFCVTVVAMENIRKQSTWMQMMMMMNLDRVLIFIFFVVMVLFVNWNCQNLYWPYVCLWFSFRFGPRHPDKNSDPVAETRFVEIKKAYELLTDEERRRAYDNHGVTNEDAFAGRATFDYSTYNRFATDPFEEFFGYIFVASLHMCSIATIK